MKGIILAAGKGTRLSPATFPISKILLPVYDRPMIYYPLSTLMMAGIKEILIITNESDLPNFKRTLRDGSQFGISIQYTIQYVQRGISDAFLIAEDFIDGDRVCLILGDNIFYSPGIEGPLEKASASDVPALVFGYRVHDPERFGVVEFDKGMNVLSLEEKPKNPKSNYAVVGLYFYDGRSSEMAKKLTPSARGELEITDLNKLYLEEGGLQVALLDDDTDWFDAGTSEALLQSSQFIYDEEKRVGKKILCPETIAYRKGFITRDQLVQWLDSNKDNEYFGAIRKETGY
ncbi:MAG: glucose-1-phosphate thymidylyltransferase RfbA [Candidatus Methanomethylophilaceae archaeon]|nr:glucose-1-phosphate thymidylyltransferase RfbA [Candidatus Methanomethylophilaceae archaeon]